MTRNKRSVLFGVLATFLVASTPTKAVAKSPQRIVSLTVCTDQLLLIAHCLPPAN